MTVADERSREPPVLVVERDLGVGRPLAEQLAADGYRVRLAHTAGHARALASAQLPALVLLGDLEPPSAALELLEEIRGGRLGTGQLGRTEARWPVGLPVIVVSAYAQEPDLLRAFEAGADDFLARPAGYLELRARLRALLGRAERGRGCQSVVVGALRIDAHVHTVELHGAPVRLRRMEYELLLHLARDPQRVFPKRELLSEVWGYAAPGCTRTLDTHACRLRHKLRALGDEQWVVNVRGVGYRLI